MLADIGIIVAVYTFTRLFDLISRPEATLLTRIAAVLSMIAIVICGLHIVTQSAPDLSSVGR